MTLATLHARFLQHCAVEERPCSFVVASVVEWAADTDEDVDIQRIRSLGVGFVSQNAVALSFGRRPLS